MLQSSSATIGILQAFSATGLLNFNGIYAVIVGIYLGDCVTTAIVCSIGAKPEARRVGIVNILFNLSETVLVLLAVTVVHRFGLLDALWNEPVNSSIIANTNTFFNLGCALLLFPMLNLYEKTSRKLVKDAPAAPEKYKEELDALNSVFFNTPALALRSCYNLLLTILRASRSNIEKSFRLLEQYDSALHRELLDEEEEIDHMTDCVSRYSVSLLPHLQLEYHVAILDQYYKVTAEFERLGDHAVNVADLAESLEKNGTHFSRKALTELAVLEDVLINILDETEQTFRRRDEDAARRIEPLVQVAGELITQLKHRHLQRMSRGECNVYADAGFTNLMVDFRRIAAVCSNVGVATVVRIHPELADHEHLYFEKMHSGGDAAFNAAYERAYQRYFSLLQREDAPEKTVPPLFADEPELTGQEDP